MWRQGNVFILVQSICCDATDGGVCCIEGGTCVLTDGALVFLLVVVVVVLFAFFFICLFTMFNFSDFGCGWYGNGYRDDDKVSSGTTGGGSYGDSSDVSFGGNNGWGSCNGDGDYATGTWGDKSVIIAGNGVDGLVAELSSMDCGDISAVDTLAGIGNESLYELIAWDTSTTRLKDEEGIGGDIVSGDSYHR